MKTLIPFFLFVTLALVACNNDDCDLAENCLLVPDFGTCDTFVVKYYYNQETQECEAYNWCGDDAPFDNMEACNICLCN